MRDNMGSYGDSTSDLDEELPVFDFLQPKRRLCQDPESPAEKAGTAATSSSSRGTVQVTSTAEVMMISSDSDDDDDAPYVPLAQRLKQRLNCGSSVSNGKHAEDGSTSSLAGAQPGQVNVPLSISQVQSVNSTLSACSAEEAAHPLSWLPKLKPNPGTGVANVCPAKGKAAKRTAEEIEVCREEALKRREARERQQKDKEALRQEQERQKAERRALSEAAKALRPEECIKHMVAAVDPALLQQEGGGTLLTCLQALGCSCAIEKQVIPHSVSWMRRSPCQQSGDGVCVPEASVVMHMTVEDFTALIHNYIQEERHGRVSASPTLTSWMQDQQRRNPGKILSLAVVDLEKYFRCQKSKSQKRLREVVAGEQQLEGKAKKRRKNNGGEVQPEVSRVEVEEALVHLQLHTGVSVRFLSSWKDFCDHIAMTTKAVAEAPFKREREQTGFSFHLESEWAGGQRVDRGGKGLLQVWRRQIQQLNRVSPDMASAILAAFPSPQLLRKAYKECQTSSQRASLLSDLLIRRGEGITSTTRRVGPELSKRLHIIMNCSDPEQTLDSTV